MIKFRAEQVWLFVTFLWMSLIKKNWVSIFFREGNRAVWALSAKCFVRAEEVSLKLLVHFIHQLAKIFSLSNVTDHIKICHDAKKFALQMMENDVEEFVTV